LSHKGFLIVLLNVHHGGRYRRDFGERGGGA